MSQPARFENSPAGYSFVLYLLQSKKIAQPSCCANAIVVRLNKAAIAAVEAGDDDSRSGYSTWYDVIKAPFFNKQTPGDIMNE